MFNLKNVDAQSTNIQLITMKDLNEIVIDALLSPISLLIKFKTIKFEKIRIYKSQNENEYQQ